MRLTEELKNALFIIGIFLFLVGATGWLVWDYMQAKSAEKARIAELKGLAVYEQMKADREIERELIPLVAKLEAMREIDKRERDMEIAKQGGIVVMMEGKQ